MYGWETRMLLKHYLDQGVSKAELSRRFGVSRATIHHWTEPDTPNTASGGTTASLECLIFDCQKCAVFGCH